MAALGVLTSQTVPTAVLGMGVVAAAGGYLVAVSMRMAIAGLTFVLTFLVAQGLFVDIDKTWEALAIGTCGGLAQAGWAAVAWALWDRVREERFELGPAWSQAVAKLRAGGMRTVAFRHALRFGAALALGVAIYRLVGLDNHGYWLPLTIVFVLKPDPNQTTERIAMRAAGTVFGLVFGNRPRGAVGRRRDPEHHRADDHRGALVCAARDRVRAVHDRDHRLRRPADRHLGAHAFDAAGERALGTVLGILVAALAFRIYGDAERDVDTARAPA